MSFKTSYKTVDYQTNLPYNCIYHVSRKDEALSEEVIKLKYSHYFDFEH